MLAPLASEAGTLFTRRRILETVWDSHWYGPTKTLDVHIASVRRKLATPSGSRPCAASASASSHHVSIATHAFDRFWITSDTGLGLAIVRQLAQARRAGLGRNAPSTVASKSASPCAERVEPARRSSKIRSHRGNEHSA